MIVWVLHHPTAGTCPGCGWRLRLDQSDPSPTPGRCWWSPGSSSEPAESATSRHSYSETMREKRGHLEHMCICVCEREKRWRRDERNASNRATWSSRALCSAPNVLAVLFESPPFVEHFGSGIRKQALATSTTASLTPSLNVQKPSRALPLWSGQRGGKQAGTRPGQEGIRQRAQFSEPASLSLSPPQLLHHRQTHTSEASRGSTAELWDRHTVSH